MKHDGSGIADAVVKHVEHVPLSIDAFVRITAASDEQPVRVKLDTRGKRSGLWVLSIAYSRNLPCRMLGAQQHSHTSLWHHCCALVAMCLFSIRHLSCLASRESAAPARCTGVTRRSFSLLGIVLIPVAG